MKSLHVAVVLVILALVGSMASGCLAIAAVEAVSRSCPMQGRTYRLSDTGQTFGVHCERKKTSRARTLPAAARGEHGLLPDWQD